MPALTMRQIARYFAIGLGFVLLFVVGPLELMRANEAAQSIAIGEHLR